MTQNLQYDWEEYELLVGVEECIIHSSISWTDYGKYSSLHVYLMYTQICIWPSFLPLIFTIITIIWVFRKRVMNTIARVSVFQCFSVWWLTPRLPQKPLSTVLTDHIILIHEIGAYIYAWIVCASHLREREREWKKEAQVSRVAPVWRRLNWNLMVNFIFKRSCMFDHKLSSMIFGQHDQFISPSSAHNLTTHS